MKKFPVLSEYENRAGSSQSSQIYCVSQSFVVCEEEGEGLGVIGGIRVALCIG